MEGSLERGRKVDRCIERKEVRRGLSGRHGGESPDLACKRLLRSSRESQSSFFGQELV